MILNLLEPVIQTKFIHKLYMNISVEFINHNFLQRIWRLMPIEKMLRSVKMFVMLCSINFLPKTSTWVKFYFFLSWKVLLLYIFFIILQWNFHKLVSVEFSEVPIFRGSRNIHIAQLQARGLFTFILWYE